MSRLDTTDAQIVRPYSRYTSRFNEDGRPPTRHFRASLQRVTRLLLMGRTHGALVAQRLQEHSVLLCAEGSAGGS